MSRFSAGLYCLVVFLFVPILCVAQSRGPADSRASLTGRVLIEDNVAPAPVRIDLRLAAEHWGTMVFTDRDGDFRIDHLPEGRYFISVSVPGCIPLEEALQVDFGSAPLILRLRRNNPAKAADTPASRSISLHELGIPEKARNAAMKADRLLAAKKYPASVSGYHRAIGIFPDFYEAYYMLAVAELHQDHASEAEAAFRKSIELSEHRYTQALSGLSVVLYIQHRFDEAEAIAREDLELDDTDATGHYAMALVSFATGRTTEAETHALQAVRYKPALSQVFLLLAQIHQRQKNHAAVVANLDAYLALAPNASQAANAKAARAAEQTILLQQIPNSAQANANP